MSKTEIIDEINRLYVVEQEFNELLNELSCRITNKEGNRPFKEIYEEVIYKYLRK